MTETYRAIAAAIEQKQTVSAVYQGLVREMCPHAIGWKNGREQCLFFQFAGGSRSGLPPGGMWRCLPLADLQLLQVYKGPRHTSPDYWHRVICVDQVTTQIR